MRSTAMRSMMPNSESMSAPGSGTTPNRTCAHEAARFIATADAREIGSLLLISVHVVHFLMPNAPAVPSRAPEGTTRERPLRPQLGLPRGVETNDKSGVLHNCPPNVGTK